MSQNGKQITIGLHKLIFLMDKSADQILQKKLKLKFSQLRMLMAIQRASLDCPCSQKDIARFWQVTEAAVSRQIEILKRTGLVATRENAKNRRANLLSLTQKGKRQLKLGVGLLDGHYDQIYKAVKPAEQTVLIHSLVTLTKKFCEQERIKI